MGWDEMDVKEGVKWSFECSWDGTGPLTPSDKRTQLFSEFGSDEGVPPSTAPLDLHYKRPEIRPRETWPELWNVQVNSCSLSEKWRKPDRETVIEIVLQFWLCDNCWRYVSGKLKNNYAPKSILLLLLTKVWEAIDMEKVVVRFLQVGSKRPIQCTTRKWNL